MSTTKTKDAQTTDLSRLFGFAELLSNSASGYPTYSAIAHIKTDGRYSLVQGWKNWQNRGLPSVETETTKLVNYLASSDLEKIALDGTILQAGSHVLGCRHRNIIVCISGWGKNHNLLISLLVLYSAFHQISLESFESIYTDEKEWRNAYAGRKVMSVPSEEGQTVEEELISPYFPLQPYSHRYTYMDFGDPISFLRWEITTKNPIDLLKFINSAYVPRIFIVPNRIIGSTVTVNIDGGNNKSISLTVRPT